MMIPLFTWEYNPLIQILGDHVHDENIEEDQFEGIGFQLHSEIPLEVFYNLPKNNNNNRNSQ